jgi:alkanesulfonate monooxygenase SsuD/methylene tetrahydromethanopterin reductase-like flavin-dependent oxidoreductase (luciferase family)
MNLGLFMMPLHPPEKSRTQCFDEDIELVVRADELGYTEAWVGQHLSLEWEPIPANDLFIATVIPRTKNIRLGTGVTIVPQHHPVNIAVRLAMLDHLARGRFSCGFGQGGVPTDWELFDLPDGKTQGLMTVEGIDMVLKLWQTEPPFDFKGQFWHIRVENPVPDINMGRILRPYQKPHPPIAMSIVKGNSMAARMAGQRGYKPLSTSLVPFGTVAEHWKTYAAGAAEAGQPEPDRALWSVSRSIFVGESDEQAMDFALNSALGRSLAYLLQLLALTNMTNLVKHDPALADEAVNVEYALKHLCIIGDTKTCTERLEELWATTGGFGTLLMMAHDWDDRDQWIRSMDRLAYEVVPKLPSL